MKSNRYAAIDCGTNTFRLLIATPADAGHPTPWQILYYGHHIPRLGEGLQASGQLCEAGMQRAVTAFADFAAAMDRYDVPADHRLACATAAVREAANGEAFCQRVLRETGIALQVIAGETEAAWSLRGACAVLKRQVQADMLLFDIGGGSTEFIRARDARQRDAISRKMGVIKLTEAHLQSDPPATSDYEAIQAAVSQHLAAVEAFWPDHTPPRHLVGTAGTITTLAATALDMAEYDTDRINNYRMSRENFLQLRERLLALTNAERAAMASIESGREDLIIAGTAIVDTVMRRWHYDHITVLDAGLLEGIWLAVQAG